MGKGKVTVGWRKVDGYSVIDGPREVVTVWSRRQDVRSGLYYRKLKVVKSRDRTLCRKRIRNKGGLLGNDDSVLQ